MSIKTEFLYGELDEEVYIKKLEGFVLKDKRTRCVSLLSHCMDLKKYQTNGIESLMQQYCP